MTETAAPYTPSHPGALTLDTLLTALLDYRRTLSGDTPIACCLDGDDLGGLIGLITAAYLRPRDWPGDPPGLCRVLSLAGPDGPGPVRLGLVLWPLGCPIDRAATPETTHE